MKKIKLLNLKKLINKEIGISAWTQISQKQINSFAECTDDYQFIHLDEIRAKKDSPFGGTIAHGFLSLSLLVHLTASLPVAIPKMEGQLMGINYGFEKIRFINPVLAGARIRAQSKISSVELKEPTAVNITRTITVEIEGQNKPAIVAEWITRSVFA